ncbi:MAG: hypothetical protein K8I29_04160 [Alphaproteobacteria bacterium]|uniref:Uncharacterized protein n=1 Tax=Candidatus Nitrobium versatile TaxID=2884831 RepID=A0A953JAU3_9BACT|nr:hypothetical protein [Candidatus Nitrobium versatile]
MAREAIAGISGITHPVPACHDPQGVRMDGITGDHTHLINFDTRIVRPAPGAAYPTFTDRGSRSGSCTLICHNVVHSSSSIEDQNNSLFYFPGVSIPSFLSRYRRVSLVTSRSLAAFR